MKGAEGSLVEDLIESMDLDGRRVYSAAGKRALVERALEPGVSVTRLALDHRVNANLLRKDSGVNYHERLRSYGADLSRGVEHRRQL